MSHYRCPKSGVCKNSNDCVKRAIPNLKESKHLKGQFEGVKAFKQTNSSFINYNVTVFIAIYCF